MPAVALSFQAAWFLALENSCLVAASAGTALLEQSILYLLWSEETSLPFLLVSIEALLPCDMTPVNMINLLLALWHGCVYNTKQNAWSTPTTVRQLRFLEKISSFHLLICRFFLPHENFFPTPMLSTATFYVSSPSIVLVTISLPMICHHTLW